MAVSRHNTVFARSFVAGLEAAGVVHACVAPGSRNTPLSMALADSGITDTSHLDERSGAFFALGLAKSTRRPVVVVTTSGTAATELHPAIAEADASAVPLIALTADRPAHLIGRSAPQTIDQRHLFGTMVRWYIDVEVDEDTSPDRAATLGSQAVAECLGAAPGPVHCNIRFREPLVIDDTPVRTPRGARLERSLRGATPDEMNEALNLLASPRGVIIAGPETWRDGVEAIAALGREWGWPVMADPLSGLRAGLSDPGGVVGSDLLASAGWLEATTPEAVLRFGAPPTSKAANTWLTNHPDVPQVVVAPWGVPDPGGTAAMFVRGDPGPVARAACRATRTQDPAWPERWKAAQAAATEALSRVTGSDLTEPSLVVAIGEVLRSGSTLWVGSSMPIRDVDSYFPVTERAIAIHGNRGANGIDGLISAALGSASAGDPTLVLTGDVGMLHDIGALATMARLQIPLTIVVVNNDGGGIFSFLPQAGHRHFERHFGTPHGLSVRAIAEGFGLETRSVTSLHEIAQAAGDVGAGPVVLEVATDRTRNVGHHREIAEAVRAALTGI